MFYLGKNKVKQLKKNNTNNLHSIFFLCSLLIFIAWLPHPISSQWHGLNFRFKSGLIRVVIVASFFYTELFTCRHIFRAGKGFVIAGDCSFISSLFHVIAHVTQKVAEIVEIRLYSDYLKNGKNAMKEKWMPLSSFEWTNFNLKWTEI